MQIDTKIKAGVLSAIFGAALSVGGMLEQCVDASGPNYLALPIGLMFLSAGGVLWVAGSRQEQRAYADVIERDIMPYVFPETYVAVPPARRGPAKILEFKKP